MKNTALAAEINESIESDCLGELKTETGFQESTTWLFPFHKALTKIRFHPAELPITGFQVQPIARPTVPNKIFVKQLKQIGLIGIAVFFEPVLVCITGGVFIAGFQCRGLNLDGGNDGGWQGNAGRLDTCRCGFP